MSRPTLAMSFLALMIALWLPTVAYTAPTKSLGEQASEAYNARDYLRCDQLYLAAAQNGEDESTSLYNAGCCFALAGKQDEAISALERSFAAGLQSVEQAKQDLDLASLRGDARWQPILDRAIAIEKSYARFWDGPSMQTPFRENLSDDEKIAGLSKLWTDLRGSRQERFQIRAGVLSTCKTDGLAIRGADHLGVDV